MRRSIFAAFAAVIAGTVAAPAHAISIEVKPTRADLVSAGDALVSVALDRPTDAQRVRVLLGRKDVTSRFALRPNGRFEALLEGIPNGAHTVTATLPKGQGARLRLVMHPNGGPVFSGPQIQPWDCQEKAVDAQCNQPEEYTFLYRSTDPAQSNLQPYDPESPPDDVATTKTESGEEVPFIVRQELGYQDRDQYKILTLFQPGTEWDRWAPPKHFNRKLLVTHGGGCGGDHGTGNAPLADLSGTLDSDTPGYTQSYVTALGRGFAVMSTALDNNGHNCNVVLQAESLIMAKERVVERYGDLRYTIGTGCSGGSITQQQVANAYPGGVYDGLVVTCAYPDSLSTGSQFADYHLLRKYFEDPSRWAPGVVWTPSQWAAVEGRPDPVNAIAADEAFFKAATNPSGDCGVPAEQVYDAETNPGGVRCSILDYMINVLGPRPESVWSENERQVGRGFAGSPFGNDGILYGLGALRQGLITPAMFVDLNEKIGGFDIDARQSPERLGGDPASIAAAYRSGAINVGNNLDRVPIIDHAGPDPGAAHDYVHTWWMRDRLEREHGHYKNHILWFGPAPLIGDVGWPTEAFLDMDRWLAAIEGDPSDKPLAQKILDAKPADIQDRCAASFCESYLSTRYGTPRTVADGPEASDTNQCALEPLRKEDLPALVSDADVARLQKALPRGVCDWSKPGVGQQDTIEWQTYQDARGRNIHGGKPLGGAPRSTPCKDRPALVVRLPRRLSSRARVFLDGERVRRARVGKRYARIAKFPAGRVRVRIADRGRTVVNRTYRVCRASR